MTVAGMASISSAGTQTWTFDSDPPLASTPSTSAWGIDRKAPAKFESKSFDGDKRLYMEHDGNAQDSEEFYWTEGRKLLIDGANVGSSLSIDMYIDSAWDQDTISEAQDQRRFDLWGGGLDSSGNRSAYPIIGFANTTASSDPQDDINIQGFQVWDGNNGGWNRVMDLSTGSNDDLFGTWVNLEMKLLNGQFKYYINDSLVYTDSNTNGTVNLDQVIIQGKNYDGDQSYGVYMDNAKINAVPMPASAWMGLSLLGLLAGGAALRRFKAASA
jgi:hypothetical protein